LIQAHSAMRSHSISYDLRVSVSCPVLRPRLNGCLYYIPSYYPSTCTSLRDSTQHESMWEEGRRRMELSSSVGRPSGVGFPLEHWISSCRKDVRSQIALMIMPRTQSYEGHQPTAALQYSWNTWRGRWHEFTRTHRNDEPRLSVWLELDLAGALNETRGGHLLAHSLKGNRELQGYLEVCEVILFKGRSVLMDSFSPL